jgi:N-acetylneuraminate synthase
MQEVSHGPTSTLKVGDTELGASNPTYFIADIAANHDGDLYRAQKLIELAASSGANAVKFQHFRAKTIVSERGFKELGSQIAHQSNWKKSVYEVYEDASLPWSWTEVLSQTAKDNGVDFFTAPYDLEAIEHVNQYVPAFKVGSGDITWTDSIEAMAIIGKPIFLATGASTLKDVKRAVAAIEKFNTPYCLMQCNTNYSGASENSKSANLRVLINYAKLFPRAVLGLSDHTPTNITTLSAITLGARAIEKHFTDDRQRTGPDHYFSLDPASWKHMVDEARLTEQALGDGLKVIEHNEVESVIVQRRALRYRRNMVKGSNIQEQDLIPLRPCPENGVEPFRLPEYVGKQLAIDVEEDQLVRPSDIGN